MFNVFQYTKSPRLRKTIDAMLFVRALLFVGSKYTCPCCGWKLRSFTKGNMSLKTRHLGYCPRCNAKARHRRDWLYLERKTNLFRDQLSLLHISPKYSLSRRFVGMSNIDYVGLDLDNRPNTKIRADVSRIPIESQSFDAVICIHVLEHVEEDHQAISEIFRALKPGGWAFISVPIRLDQDTYEDPTITAPAKRKRAFGEEQHVRIYGHDFQDLLEKCGFQVEVDLAETIDKPTKEKYGLMADENIFYCTKI